MKKFFFRMILGSLMLFSISYGADAQIFVKVRPTISLGQRPVRPSRRHVWVNDEWSPEGNGYRQVGGHWDVPPQRGNRWRRGYWRHHGNDGDEWVGGRWRR